MSLVVVAPHHPSRAPPASHQECLPSVQNSSQLLQDATMALRTDEADPSPFQVSIPTAEEVERYARMCLLMEGLDSKGCSIAHSKTSHPRRRSVVGSIEEKRHRLNLDGIMMRHHANSVGGENDSLTTSSETSDSESSSPLRLGMRRKRLASWRLPSAPRLNNSDSKTTTGADDKDGDDRKAKSSANDEMVDRLFSSVEDLVVEHCFSVTPPPETAASSNNGAKVHATVFRSDELRQLIVCYCTDNTAATTSESKEKAAKRGHDRLVNAKVVELASTFPFYDVVFAGYGPAASLSVRSSVMYAGCNPMIRVKSFAYGWTHVGNGGDAGGMSQPERELAHSLPNLSIVRVENGRDVSSSDQPLVGHCLHLDVAQRHGRCHTSERHIPMDRIESSRRLATTHNNSASASPVRLVTAARIYKFGQDVQSHTTTALPLSRSITKRRGLVRGVGGGSAPTLLLMRNPASAASLPLSSLRNNASSVHQQHHHSHHPDHLLSSYIQSLEQFTLQRHFWIQGFVGEEGEGIPAALPTITTKSATNLDGSNHDRTNECESRHIV